MKSVAARVSRRLREAEVTGNQHSVADRRYDRKVARPAIQIDNQSRVPREYGVGAEAGLQSAGDAGGADVPGDMVAQIAIGNAECAERGRKTVTRVVANENDTAIAAALDQIVGRGLIGTNEFCLRQGVTFQRTVSIASKDRTLSSPLPVGLAAAFRNSEPGRRIGTATLRVCSTPSMTAETVTLK